VASQNESINTLYLSTNEIADEGIEHISEYLKNNKCIQFLYLASNKIENQGAKFISSALKVNQTLKVLNLSSNAIGDEGAKSIEESLKDSKSSIVELNLFENPVNVEILSSIEYLLKKWI